MIGELIGITVTALLDEPGSPDYERIREIVNERPTLYDALVQSGLWDTLTATGKGELYWVCAMMPDEQSDAIMQRVRVALNAGIPVEVSWRRGLWSVRGYNINHEHGAALSLHVFTPIPDLSKIPAGTWFGTSVKMAAAI